MTWSQVAGNQLYMKNWQPLVKLRVHSCLDWVVRHVVSSSTYQCSPKGTAKSASCSCPTWNLSGNSRPQLVCIEKQAMFCHETTKMLSLSRRGRANGWRSMFPDGCLLQDPVSSCQIVGSLSSHKPTCTARHIVVSRQPDHFTWTTPELEAPCLWAQLWLGDVFREPQANLYCTSFNDRQTIRFNRSLVVCSLWAEATY